MRIRNIAVVLLVTAGTAATQANSARPSVTVLVTGMNVSAEDSSGALAALRRGLEADSLTYFVDPAPAQRPPERSARWVVAALLRRTGDVVVLTTRTFDAKTSAITVKASTTSAPPAMGDSASAVGRRIARALAARQS